MSACVVLAIICAIFSFSMGSCTISDACLLLPSSFTSIIHNLFMRRPDITVVPFSFTDTIFFSKVTVNPASHNMPIDNSDPVRSLKMCTVRNFIGNHFHFSLPIATDLIMDPSGCSTSIPSPTLFGTMFSIASVSLIAIKCPVVPVSALAKCFAVAVAAAADCVLCFALLIVLENLLFELLLSTSVVL